MTGTIFTTTFDYRLYESLLDEGWQIAGILQPDFGVEHVRQNFPQWPALGPHLDRADWMALGGDQRSAFASRIDAVAGYVAAVPGVYGERPAGERPKWSIGTVDLEMTRSAMAAGLITPATPTVIVTGGSRLGPFDDPDVELAALVLAAQTLLAEFGLGAHAVPESERKVHPWLSQRLGLPRRTVESEADEVWAVEVDDVAETWLSNLGPDGGWPLVALSGAYQPRSTRRRDPSSPAPRISERHGSDVSRLKELARRLPRRSGAVVVGGRNPMHALAAVGFWGGVVWGEPAERLLASWQAGHGAYPWAFSHDELRMLVLDPPHRLEQATIVAAEHLTLCPDVLQLQGMDSVEQYAEHLVGNHFWSFWWD